MFPSMAVLCFIGTGKRWVTSCRKLVKPREDDVVGGKEGDEVQDIALGVGELFKCPV